MIVFLLLTLCLHTILSKTEGKVYTRPGHYYNHMCQISFELVSDDFGSKEILFIHSMENIKFIEKKYSYTPVILRLADGRQQVLHHINNCFRQQTSTFQCAYISYSPFSTQVPKIPLNQTHDQYIFRLGNAVCPRSHENNEIAIKIQRIDVEKQEIKQELQLKTKLTNLTYKEVQKIHFSEIQNFKVGCKGEYKLSFEVWNHTHIWKQLSITLTHQHIRIIPMPEYQIQHNTILFNNLQFTQPNKYYQYDDYELYPFGYRPNIYNFTFTIIFYQPETVSIKATVSTQTSRFPQHSVDSEREQYIYGYGQNFIYGLDQPQFNKVDGWLRVNSCFQNQQPFYEQNVDVLIIFVVSLMSFLLCICRRGLFVSEKYCYLILISSNAILKVIYILHQRDQNNKFIILSFLLIEFCLNFIYFFTYLSFVILHTQVRTTYTPFLLFLTLLLFLDFRYFAIILFKVKQMNPGINHTYLHKKHSLHLLMSITINILSITFIFSLHHLKNIQIIYTVLLIHQLVLFYMMALTLKVIFHTIKDQNQEAISEEQAMPSQDESAKQTETQTNRPLSS